MLSALIRSAGRQPAVPLAGQLAHESCVRPGPLVLGTAPLKSPTPVEDRDRHICYRRSSRALLRGPGHFCLALHVAMQVGPYLHRSVLNRKVFGIWSLRILNNYIRCTRRYRPPPFMESAALLSATKPSALRCSPRAIALTMRANVEKS